MRKLSARMRTEQEIRQLLRKAEYSVDETEAAIAELKSYGYLHDERYCREYFLYAKARGKADARIVRELAQKGISAETARNVIEDLRAAEMQDGGEIAEDRDAASVRSSKETTESLSSRRKKAKKMNTACLCSFMISPIWRN